MNSRRLLPWLLFSAMLVATLAVPAQQTVRRGRPVIFSNPNRDAGTTNLDHVATKRMTLESLENELKKPFEIFDVADPSRRQVTVPPMHQLPAPKLDNKKLRALFEKEKDWAFKTPEDYEAEFGLSASEIFKIPEYNPDGSLKKKTTAMERYYERLQNPRVAETNQTSNSLSPWDRNENQREEGFFAFGRQPGTTSSLDQSLKRFSGDKRDSQATDPTKPRTIADFFSIGSVETPAALKAQELRLEEYKKILDPHAVTPAPGSSPNLFPNNLAGAPGSIARPNPLPGGNHSRDSLGFLPTVAGGPTQPQGLPDAFSRLPTTIPPLPNSEKPAPPPAPPAFALPKRKF